ncbi:hypothetical protein L6259_00560 [Candidatus Parcubacteria bacterium]|nr:hypothetical protein [Candidatus Parcubacteria bacterium]
MNKKTSLRNILILVVSICGGIILIFSLYQYLSTPYLIAVFPEDESNFQNLYAPIINITGGSIDEGLYLGYIAVRIPKIVNFNKTNIKELLKKLKEIQGVKAINFPAPQYPIILESF